MRRYLTFSLLLAAVAFCLPAGPSGLVASSDLREAEALVERYLSACNAPDPVALAGLYAEDGLVVPPSGGPVSGREAIQSYWMKSSRRALIFDIAQKNVCGDAGYFVGKYKARRDPGRFTPAGPFTLTVLRMQSSQAGIVQGSFTLCVRRSESGDWRIATDMWNENVPEGFLRAGWQTGYTPAAQPQP
jgi:ketosteroid isomerase-like protein